MKQNIQIQQSFSSALIKVQNNLINSFKLLQDNLNNTIESLHNKTSLMEDKILQILHNKQKVIVRLHNSIQSLKGNLATVEESLVNLANSKAGDNYSVIETHVNLKLEKFIRGEREKMGELESQIMKMETRLEQKIDKGFDFRLNKNNFDGMRNRINALQIKIEDSSKPISNYNSGEDVSSIRQQLKQINKLVSKIMEDSNRQQKKIKEIQQNSFRSTPQNTTDRNYQNKRDVLSYNKYQTNDDAPKNKFNFNEQNQVVPQVMEVGLRGLRKSKEKRQINEKSEGNLLQNSKPLSLPAPNSMKKKDLPPLSKQPPLKSKRNQVQMPTKEEILNELGEIFVDQEGYLIDKDGNYLRDQDGNLIDAEGLSEQSGYDDEY